MEDFNKSYDSLAVSAKEILERNLTEARSMDINRTSRFIDELAVSLKRGSKLNKEINKTPGGSNPRGTLNYDREFKTMQDAMDIIFDTWQSIEGEIEMNEETLNILIDEAIELNEDELAALLKDAGISLLRKGGKLLLKVAKGTARLAGKALKKSTIVMLKALLKKAESVETTPKEYDLFIQNMDQAGYTPAINAIAQRDSLYKGAYSGSTNPFERGTLAYQMYDDLGS